MNRPPAAPAAPPRLTEPPPFDVLAPLPQPGEPPLLLEASAGTGKTWTIGALVARYVAEGRPLDSILVITFGRTASRELRERVRWHLRGVLTGLADPAEPTWGADPVATRLREGSPDEVATRRERLRTALTEFDAATIATTHQFCQVVLRSLGVAGDADPDTRLVEDLTDLLEEVVDDLYVRGFSREDAQPVFTRDEAGRIAERVVADPHARLLPDHLDGAGRDARRLRFAHRVRQEMAHRKRRQGVLSFDDLLTDLAQSLRGDDSPAAGRMIARWQVVLVDEFQDTDPVQWSILRRAFVGRAALVLIGDPKQAIYAFRGGDVDAYLHAADSAGALATLATNRRTDAPLVRALGAMLDGVELGSDRIVVRPVTAHCDARLTGPDGLPARLPPHRLRFVPAAGPGAVATGSDAPGDAPGRNGRGAPIGVLRDHVARDCAAQIGDLLSAGLRFDGAPVVASDIAVLAHTRRQLEVVRTALTAAGIPSIIAAEESIFAGPAAAQWLVLLDALARPHRPDRARAAALTPFLGYDAARVAALDDAGMDALTRTLAQWAALAGRRGIAAVQAAATAGGMDAAVLRHAGGDRHLTDLRHVGELLHERMLTEREGLAGLIRWLRERMAATRAGERTRRLESDADAVRLATIHASKGLQYPIVMLPFVADRWRESPEELHFHDREGRRCLDIGITSDPGRAAREEAHQREADGESLRLLYVALTRAQSHLVTWWFASAKNTTYAPLHRLLFGRRPGPDGDAPGEVPVAARVPDDATARAVLQAWAGRGAFAVEEVGPPDTPPLRKPAALGPLDARAWTRRIDTGWRRTSYTALTRPLDEATYGAGGAGSSGAPAGGPGGTSGAPALLAGPEDDDLVDSEPETGAREGDSDTLADLAGVPDAAAPATPLGPAETVPANAAVLLPMATLPVGANFGSLVHEVLEMVDPGAGDLAGAVRAQIDERCARWGLADIDRATLARALRAVYATPLGPLLPGVTLGDIGARDRLTELPFDLPLARGDLARDGDGALLGDLAGLLRAHLPEGDPVRGLADALDDPVLGDQPLRGYLTGAVDVVLRHEGRYVVVDYKTNWLAPPGEPLTAAHYAPAQLRAAMGHSSYPLQALLYAVVLHRFLRWRLRGYDPARHLGGVLYLYVRGMSGADAPVVDGHPAGVFSWRPPVDLVLDVSALLDGVPR